MTSWSCIGFCCNEHMYLPSFKWFFVIIIYTSSCRLEHSSLVLAPVHIMQEFFVLSRKSADHRANLHIMPKFGLVIPTFSSLSLWFMKPLLDCHHPSSNGSLSQCMSYISSHIHSKYLWILISSLVMGILYMNLVIDTDISLSIIILSPLPSLSMVYLKPCHHLSPNGLLLMEATHIISQSYSQSTHHANFIIISYRQMVYRCYQNS